MRPCDKIQFVDQKKPLTPPPRRRHGFTLIELLVVIGLIALLIAIVLPGLAKSRDAARNLQCLSNHRQLGIAWLSYTNDYGVFPYGVDAATYRTHERFAWGGVNWYPATGVVPGFNVQADRPLNPYLSSDARIEQRLDVFRCPLDTGTYEYATGVSGLAGLGATSASGEPTTNFGVVGTSYECNEWMYCRPGSINGWGTFPSYPHYRSKQSPADVQISPSRFVMLSDSGPINWMMSTVAQRQNYLGGSWWHGKERGNLTFLDGSARLEKSGRLVCDRYSIHMISFPNPNATWRRPGTQ